MLVRLMSKIYKLAVWKVEKIRPTVMCFAFQNVVYILLAKSRDKNLDEEDTSFGTAVLRVKKYIHNCYRKRCPGVTLNTSKQIFWHSRGKSTTSQHSTTKQYAFDRKKAKREARHTDMAGKKVRWTYLLILDICNWIIKEHREVNSPTCFNRTCH